MLQTNLLLERVRRTEEVLDLALCQDAAIEQRLEGALVRVPALLVLENKRTVEVQPCEAKICPGRDAMLACFSKFVCQDRILERIHGLIRK